MDPRSGQVQVTADSSVTDAGMATLTGVPHRHRTRRHGRLPGRQRQRPHRHREVRDDRFFGAMVRANHVS
ncbi:hypothetical protein [Amycolatopsis sp. H20-H5]|uniref:hypothetical protein n=1 Tax=Amycolatopsis sp. H20-H5 TaxID=3046309 RepID=UPI003FA3692A